MPLVYVFAASNMEAQPVLVLAARDNASGQGSTGLIVERGDEHFAVIITGMGMGNAESKADSVLQTAHPRAGGESLRGKPDAILIIGLCGGLTQGLPVQRIVAYKECLSTSPNKAPPLQCSPALTADVLKHLQQHDVAVDSVVGITSPRIATTNVDRLALAKSGAGVVDMESYPILAAAARAGVPAVVLRVVSDSLDTKMPDFNPALNAIGALDGRKALWIGLRSPVETYRLLATNKRAIEQLKPAVKFIVESDCFSSTRNTMKN